MAEITKKVTSGRGLASLVVFMNEHPDWIILDNSQNAEYGTCPERYNHKYNRGVHANSGPAAEFGKWMVHEPFEHWYSHGMDAAAMPTDKQWNEWWLHFTETQGGAPMKPNEQAAYQPAYAKAALQHYIMNFGNDAGMYKVLHTEQVFWSTLPNLPGVVWLSKPDLVLELIASGTFMTVDIKSSVWGNGENLIPFDRQFVGQGYATGSTEMMKIFVRFEVRNIRDRQVNVTTSRQRVKLDEEVIGDWLRDTEHDAAHILESHRTGVWPKRAPIACHQFNRLCEMYSLCEVGRSQAGKMYGHMLRTNPLEYLGLTQDKNGQYLVMPTKNPRAYVEHKQRVGKTPASVDIGQMFGAEIEDAWPVTENVTVTSNPTPGQYTVQGMSQGIAGGLGGLAGDFGQAAAPTVFPAPTRARR